MTTRWDPRIRKASALALAVLLVALARPAAGAVQVALVPEASTIAPGAEFDVTMEITAAGSAFNAFAVTVGYDTTALTFLPSMPLSAQQGCLMTGLCSGACGNTFHRFTATHDSLVISNSLLCNQVSLTGPGTIYRLRFRAANTAQATTIRFLEATFLDAGLFIGPVTATDAQVGIGMPLAVGEAPPPRGLSVRAEPNPARDRLAFATQSDLAGERRVEVYDLAGRLVRRLDGGRRDPGPARVGWDGTDGRGARVGPGVYLVVVRVADRIARGRFALVD